MPLGGVGVTVGGAEVLFLSLETGQAGRAPPHCPAHLPWARAMPCPEGTPMGAEGSAELVSVAPSAKTVTDGGLWWPHFHLELD